jgi:hypothetical protein
MLVRSNINIELSVITTKILSRSTREKQNHPSPTPILNQILRVYPTQPSIQQSAHQTDPTIPKSEYVCSLLLRELAWHVQLADTDVSIVPDDTREDVSGLVRATSFETA